jgi:hypothetical protein
MQPLLPKRSDAANPAMALWSAIEGQGRRVAAAPIFGVKIPPGYRDWRLISMAHEERQPQRFARHSGQQYSDQRLWQLSITGTARRKPVGRPRPRGGADCGVSDEKLSWSARGNVAGVCCRGATRPGLSKMNVGLYSQCMKGNSQYEAISRRPDLFENVRCMCSPMVVSVSAIYSAMSELQGVSQYQELIDLELLKMGGFVAAEMTPHHSAPAVKMPVLMIQVTHGRGTLKTRKRHPEKVISFFDRHMK